MSTKTQDSVHSNAFNFGGFVAGGVDPRTGIYTCALTLGVIRSGDLNGPSFNLALSFNPLNTHNAGYGTWTCPYKTGHQLPVKLMQLPSA